MRKKPTYEQRFGRLLKSSCVYSPARYRVKMVQPRFNQMIRAEAGAFVGMVPCVNNGRIWLAFSPLGYCVCVTCAAVHPWKDPLQGGRLDAGHYLTGARVALEATNCHCQCVHCNRDQSGSGANYRLYMQHVYGQDEIDRLYRIKNTKTYEPPAREWLIAKRIECEDRIELAVEKMK